MLRTVYESSLGKILILESWALVALQIELSWLNSGLIFFALLVLLIQPLQGLLTELILILLCPLNFYLNASSDLIAKASSVLFFFLVILLIKMKRASSKLPAEENDYLYDQETQEIAAFDSLLAAKEKGMSSFDAFLPPLDDFPELKSLDPGPYRRRIRIPGVAFMFLAGGLVAGVLWQQQSTKTSLSYSIDSNRYTSYLSPHTYTQEEASLFFAQAESNNYLGSPDSPPNGLKILTFQKPTALLHSVSQNLKQFQDTLKAIITSSADDSNSSGSTTAIQQEVQTN